MDAYKNIIEGIQKQFPLQQQNEIKNLQDLERGFDIKPFYQYIIGLTQKDPMGSGFDHYQNSLKRGFERFGFGISFFAWRFTAEEQAELKENMKNLAEAYNIEINIDYMISKLRIRNGVDYFLVFSVVAIPIISEIK
jgi:hypothetical protein